MIHSLKKIVLGAVQFNNKICFMAVKVSNIISNDILPAELIGIATEKTLPKNMFFFCRAFSQLLR